MPTLKQMVKKVMEMDVQTDEPGAYPVMFKDDWTKIKFVWLLRWETLKAKVKKICHL